MKKFIIVSAFALGAFTANAQTGETALQGTKFGDNWSIGINAGAVTPLTHSSFFKDARPAFGFGITKQLTPVFGLGIQGMGYVNTTQSKTAFDASDVSLLGKVNLMNLFGGYQGSPRLFEIEALAGMGWLHYYMNGPGDQNSWSTRFGMNLNFNLGETKAWTLGVRPAIVYDMEGDFNTAKSRFNVNNAAFELTAGITYHFMTSNGTHHFTNVKPYDPVEIANLNSAVNDLRSQVNNKDNQLINANQQVNALQSELNECRNKVVPVETVVKTNRIPESIITFRQGKSVVDASQLPNVERVASYMNKHMNATVVIKGYASPEGNLAFNEKLAKARAEAIKTILVKKYKIDAARITAEGQGIGDMFSEPDWNRVSICTIDESK
ncbi:MULTISPECIES: OmpA family protein [Bacteroides]|jgi:outer membrane protein OmpA-like peptidoglycan-associated protein|uniref:OmpA family protein n=1 Tax=Bacteroides TaxID=816 RepID=UPI001F3F59FC|nr:OmpA family protein [Bacteroides nordii]MCE8465917.1 OmpA family protein [Bacteroides nordii]UYU49827.1 OmpA family protein [Bacteroides nordii]DAZ20144.1 MAG TPA: OmpA family protein [Caudoviricetes sp.]